MQLACNGSFTRLQLSEEPLFELRVERVKAQLGLQLSGACVVRVGGCPMQSILQFLRFFECRY